MCSDNIISPSLLHLPSFPPSPPSSVPSRSTFFLPLKGNFTFLITKYSNYFSLFLPVLNPKYIDRSSARDMEWRASALTMWLAFSPIMGEQPWMIGSRDTPDPPSSYGSESLDFMPIGRCLLRAHSGLQLIHPRGCLETRELLCLANRYR